MGKENSVGPSPIFPPTFSSQIGGILGQIFSPTLYPCHSRSSSPSLSHSSQNILLLLSLHLQQLLISSISGIFLAPILSFFASDGQIIPFFYLACFFLLIVERWRTLGVCVCSILCLFSMCVCLLVH